MLSWYIIGKINNGDEWNYYELVYSSVVPFKNIFQKHGCLFSLLISGWAAALPILWWQDELQIRFAFYIYYQVNSEEASRVVNTFRNKDTVVFQPFKGLCRLRKLDTYFYHMHICVAILIDWDICQVETSHLLSCLLIFSLFSLNVCTILEVSSLFTYWGAPTSFTL